MFSVIESPRNTNGAISEELKLLEREKQELEVFKYSQKDQLEKYLKYKADKEDDIVKRDELVRQFRL